MHENSDNLHNTSRIVIIAGATAVGKSDFAVDLALKINGEIISADSMQIYKGMDIGTGKINEVEKRGIQHYMLDVIEPNQSFSVSQYVELAKLCIAKIIAKDKLPIIVGGTGLYINALINGHNFANTEPSEAIRKKYQDILDVKGLPYLHDMLQKVDKASAEKISINDCKRIIRALEIFDLTGQPKSQKVSTSKSEYLYKMFVLNMDRTQLYNRINLRVDKMFDSGLVKEVEKFMPFKNMQALQAIGYKEVVAMLENNLSLDQTIQIVKQNSRHYAKRQLTYFRWIDAEKIWIENDFYVEKVIEMLNK